jgi:hypothetical protein
MLYVEFKLYGDMNIRHGFIFFKYVQKAEKEIKQLLVDRFFPIAI